jgi:hypothetical protein
VENPLSLLENKQFTLELSERGTVWSLVIKDDPSQMNWVVDQTYVEEAGYGELDRDKQLGEWMASIAGQTLRSTDYVPQVQLAGSDKAIYMLSLIG